jgi:hypothetical protein
MNIIEFYYQERFKMMCKISFILLALAQKWLMRAQAFLLLAAKSLQKL